MVVESNLHESNIKSSNCKIFPPNAVILREYSKEIGSSVSSRENITRLDDSL